MIFVCEVCGWEYDEDEGFPELDIEPGTAFEDLDEDFECPHCAVGKENFSPAGIVSLFQEESEQREVAELFDTKLTMLDTLQEREKAFHDVLLKVKENSLEYYSSRLGSDVTAINQVIVGKIALENLKRTHISFQE